VLEVRCRQTPFPRSFQRTAVELGGEAAGIVEGLMFRVLTRSPAGSGNGDPRPVRKRPDRFDERELFPGHHEAEDVPARPAAETVVHLPFRADGERGGLLLVERTEADVALPPLPEGDGGGDDVHDVGRPTHFVDGRFRDAHHGQAIYQMAL
jgi:hypothetical protein